ncbi:endospore germination permease [Neobacillus sp. MM2021_6]|nr:endospore germination permease [Neobacillus sp. MM2021_6]NHC21460.1 endospore germination permease [Bacillus sp. MM2020_4]
MNSSNPISIFQIVLLIITAVGLKNHVFAIPPLIQTAQKDSWLSVILALFITLLWLFIIIGIYQKTKKENVFQWLLRRVNKWVVYIMIGVLLIVLTIICSETLRETITWVHVSLLPQTPRSVTAISFGIVCFLMAKTNLKSICIINQSLLFFIVILGFFVATVNIQYKDYSLLRPIFEHGYAPIIRGIIFPLSGFTEFFLVLIIQDKVKETFRFRHFVITALLLTGLTIGPLIGAIIEFSQGEAEKLRFPAYEEWQLVSIGQFIEHVFFFVIYQWLSGAFIRITFLFYLIRELLALNKNGKVIIYAVFIIIEILTLFPLSDFKYTEILFYVLLPFSAWFFLGFSILFYLIIYIASKKDRRVNNEA